MAVQAKLNGAWSSARINLKYNNVWHEENTTWVKLGGTWRAFIPEGVIIPYYTDTLEADCVLCDGNNGTVNLLNRYLYHKKTETTYSFNPGVNQSHTAVAHHTLPGVSVSQYAHPHMEQDFGFDINVVIVPSYHEHSASASSFSSESPIDVSPEGIKVIPTVGGKYIYENAILFRKNNTVIPNCIAFLKKYINFMSSYGTRPSTLHRHYVNGTFGSWSTTHNTYNNWGTYTVSLDTHYHTFSNVLTGYGENAPYSTSFLYGNKVSSLITWDQLPTQTVVCFIGTTATIPKGWSILDYNDGFVRVDGAVSSTTTHSHDIAGTTGTSSTAVFSKGFKATMEYNNPAPGYIVTPGHTHSVYIGTTPGINLDPACVKLKLIVKD